MPFELRDDTSHAEFKRLRANLASSWSGPKSKIIEVELAALEPNGLMSTVCPVPTVDSNQINCVEAVPECVLDPSSRRLRLAGFSNARKRA
eukprot:7826530-Alexandrium_andersonii.AAC.1